MKISKRKTRSNKFPLTLHTGYSDHMLDQSRRRPGGETIAQCQRIGLYGLSHLFDIFQIGPTWTTCWLDRMQGFGFAFSVEPPDASHCICTTTQVFGDRSFGPVHCRHQNNCPDAKRHRRLLCSFTDDPTAPIGYLSVLLSVP